MSRIFGEPFDSIPFEKKGPGSKFMNDFECIKRDFGSNGTEEEFEIQMPMQGVQDSDNYDSAYSQVKFDKYVIANLC
jgi:hypothetical protein